MSSLKVKSILVTQPKPETDKSPYFDLSKKFSVKIDFRPFIHVEPIPAANFRKDNSQAIRKVFRYTVMKCESLFLKQ